jgi:hypothetical protein
MAPKGTVIFNAIEQETLFPEPFDESFINNGFEEDMSFKAAVKKNTLDDSLWAASGHKLINNLKGGPNAIACRVSKNINVDSSAATCICFLAHTTDAFTDVLYGGGMYIPGSMKTFKVLDTNTRTVQFRANMGEGTATSNNLVAMEMDDSGTGMVMMESMQVDPEDEGDVKMLVHQCAVFETISPNKTKVTWACQCKMLYKDPHGEFQALTDPNKLKVVAGNLQAQYAGHIDKIEGLAGAKGGQ